MCVLHMGRTVPSAWPAAMRLLWASSARAVTLGTPSVDTAGLRGTCKTLCCEKTVCMVAYGATTGLMGDGCRCGDLNVQPYLRSELCVPNNYIL